MKETGLLLFLAFYDKMRWLFLAFYDKNFDVLQQKKWYDEFQSYHTTGAMRDILLSA